MSTAYVAKEEMERIHLCPDLSHTYLVRRGTAGQDLWFFQDVCSPKPTEGKTVGLYLKIHTVGKVHYLQSLTILIDIIRIVDSESRLKRKR